MIKTPEMLEATHKRHTENWREELDHAMDNAVYCHKKKGFRLAKRFDSNTKPFGGFPGIEKIA